MTMTTDKGGGVLMGETVQLTEEGRRWAEANPDSIVANVALYGDGWPLAFVETSRRVANEAGKEADLKVECLDDDGASGPCSGKVEYRTALSATGRSFPRCDHHWSLRLDEQERIDRRYPATRPSDFDPSYAGERWDDED